MRRKSGFRNTAITEETVAKHCEMLKRHHIAKSLEAHRLLALAELLCNLDNVSDSGEGWSARCPAHPDSRNSFSLNLGTNGKFLVTCHRGCGFDEIVQSLNILPQEMFSTLPSVRNAVLPPRRPRYVAPSPTTADPAWEEKQTELTDPIHDVHVQTLAENLEVDFDSLKAIGVGWYVENGCWTFPERNGDGHACGIIRRFQDGRKLAFAGSHRGLTLPHGWEQAKGPLHICEGASDVAAATSAGLRAIGRPAAHAGFSDLAVLLRGFGEQILVVADNDASGTGLEGAEKLAGRLSTELKINIEVVSPPMPYKDLRQYFNAGGQK